MLRLPGQTEQVSVVLAEPRIPSHGSGRSAVTWPGTSGFRRSSLGHKSPEIPRDCKGLLTKARPEGTGPIRKQSIKRPLASAMADLKMAREHADSFDKFYREVSASPRDRLGHFCEADPFVGEDDVASDRAADGEHSPLDVPLAPRPRLRLRLNRCLRQSRGAGRLDRARMDKRRDHAKPGNIAGRNGCEAGQNSTVSKDGRQPR